MIGKIIAAGIVDEYSIEYSITPEAHLSNICEVKLYAGDEEVKITDISSIGEKSSTGFIKVEHELDLSLDYRLEIEGYGSKTVVPTKIFDSEFFAAKYHYDGDDLGAILTDGMTTFKVWAPTASRVLLNLFTAGDGIDAYKTADMARGEYGIWSFTEKCGHGTYYTYTVSTSVGIQEAVDPYAKSTGVNGNRGMVVDLALTDPYGWAESELPDKISKYSEAVIWEVHLRDFSNKIESSKYKGKYLAFTERGLINEHGISVGVDYLVKLGVTHVHLLPVCDFATVDESSGEPQFNWGYDPKNFNAPEGSYSTDAYNGEVRVREFKEMVMALHKVGIGVVVDVVYNHTYELNSSLNKIVPYYYYRYTLSGENTSSSGCGNDTASERYMYGKFMVESAKYWVSEYKLDGLRFDLMGLHDLDTMQRIESAVHSVNPNAVIYGEGWTMGSTINGSAQANQSNICKIEPSGKAIGGIAVFNDVIRDGLKGSVFDKTGRGFINGSPETTMERVMFGIKGGQDSGYGWSVVDGMIINYMSAHDNNTLWDKLRLSNPSASDDKRCYMNRLGAAIIMISRGTPFLQAGEEMLRTKNGDENSYKSSDAINNIDWSVLFVQSREYKTMLYYKGLIEMRKSYTIFSDLTTEISCTVLESSVLAVEITARDGSCAFVIINPGDSEFTYELDGEWMLVADSNRAGKEVLATESGEVKVSPIGIKVYINTVKV